MTAAAPIALSAPVYLIRGGDQSLLTDAVLGLIDALVGDDDRSLMVEDVGAEAEDCSAVVDAAQTSPFLTERRIVVARSVDRFRAGDLAPLLRYLDQPLPTTILVVVWEEGDDPQRPRRVPKGLSDAIGRAGGIVVDTSAPTGKARQGWLDAQVAATGVRLDASARALLTERLGEDVGRVSGILQTLASAYGHERLGVDELGPFLGEAGGAPPWELTDAVDGGDTATALDRLGRMLGAGGRHPLVVLASLHNHYERMLRLEGSAANDERSAAALLGLKGSTFPARKALNQSKRLGRPGLARALELLVRADLDLRGAKDWPDRLVMEVLVARLSRLTPRGVGSGARPRS